MRCLARSRALLRRLDPDVGADLLGEDSPMLAPLLGAGPLAPLASAASVAPPGSPPVRGLADGLLGPAVLYAALVRVIGRIARAFGSGPLVVVIDDAHLAGQPLANWLSFARRETMPAVVVAAVRSGEGPVMPASALVHLDTLGREAVAELVGPSRADQLYERSEGPPAVPHRARPAGLARRAARLAGRVGVRAVRRARRGRSHAARRGGDRA